MLCDSYIILLYSIIYYIWLYYIIIILFIYYGLIKYCQSPNNMVQTSVTIVTELILFK